MILKDQRITWLGKRGHGTDNHVQTFESIYIYIYGFKQCVYKINSCRYKTQIIYLSLYTYARETKYTHMYLYI